MFDVLIRRGTIVDGTGRPRFVGDLAISDGQIREVGPSITEPAKRVIEAEGLMVCPGFIDVHAHDDLAVLHDHELPYKLMQGITTTIIGNCGHSVAPMPVDEALRDALRAYVEPVLGRWGEKQQSFGYLNIGDYYEALETTEQSVNVGALVGHGPLRVRVMGFADRRATPAEITQMQQLLAEAMAAGALGLSLGLMYTPGCFADKEELIALAQTVKSYDGIVTAHIRGEGDLLLPSIEEMLEMAQASNVSLHISHLKAVGRHNWGTVDKAIQRIRAARSAGLDVTCDAYPYAAGSTTLLSLLPPWMLQDGVGGVLAHLADAQTRARVAQALAAQGDGWENVALITGWERVVLTSSAGSQIYQGKSIAEVAEMLHCDAVEAYFRVIEATEGIGTIVIHHMADADVERVLAFEHATVGSDGLPSREGHPHPRLYGTFPRFISKYVREGGMLTLEQAVQKVTSFAVDRFQLGQRGRLLPGYVADVVVFDFAAFSDAATYAEPKQFAPGLAYVLVNGELVCERGNAVGAHPGQLIHRKHASVR